jgi:predicted Zn-dependent protease
MKSFNSQDAMHLNAAEGWLGLGSPIEANDELEKIAPEMRLHPEVLMVRYEVYAQEKRWDACVFVASTIVKLEPESSFGWVHRSFALHELKRTKEALNNLLPALEYFPEEITIRYNLACYECVLGNLPQAKLRLAETLNLAQSQKCFDEWHSGALADKDLEPLWDTLGERGNLIQ